MTDPDSDTPKIPKTQPLAEPTADDVAIAEEIAREDSDRRAFLQKAGSVIIARVA